jgi:hypothetical protein
MGESEVCIFHDIPASLNGKSSLYGHEKRIIDSVIFDVFCMCLSYSYSSPFLLFLRLLFKMTIYEVFQSKIAIGPR